MADNENEFNRSLGRMEGKMDAMVNSVNALAASFENLEKGRLSRLEIAFAEMKTITNDKARMTSFWTSIIVSISTTVAAAYIIAHFFPQ